jgi:hypothetical protein
MKISDKKIKVVLFKNRRFIILTIISKKPAIQIVEGRLSYHLT